MSILKVAQLGNPVLRNGSEEISDNELQSQHIQKLIDDMIETMHEYGGLGLAAPQVHEPKKIIVIEAVENERYNGHPEIPLTVIINPVIAAHSSNIKKGWEGCLSLNGLRGLVSRYSSVRVEGLDRDGKDVVFDDDGFLSVIIQHEIDHLNGLTFVDRMEDMKTLSFLEEFERFVDNNS